MSKLHLNFSAGEVEGWNYEVNGDAWKQQIVNCVLLAAMVCVNGLGARSG